MCSTAQLTRSRRAFTLVEIMVVITIIGLLCATLVPAYRRVTLRAKAVAFQNDVQTYANAFSAYSLQNGRWPVETDPGILPTEMSDALRDSFAKPTPIGGFYDWDYDVSANGFYTRAAITIATTAASAMSQDLDLLEQIDRNMDDGNLNTGNVRLGSTNALVVIIER